MTASITSSFTPPVAPQSAAPASAVQQQSRDDFARMLSQRQAQAGAPEVTGAEPAKKADPAARHEVAAQSAAAQTQTQIHTQAAHDDAAAHAEKPRAAAVKSPAAKAGREAAVDDKGAANDPTGKADKADGTDPALANWLSALHLPPATPTTPADASAAGAVDPATTDANAAADAALSSKAGKNARAVGAPDTSALEGTLQGTRAARASETQAAATSRGAKESAAASLAAQAAGSPQTSAAATWQAIAEQAALPTQGSDRKESSAVDPLGAAGAANGVGGASATPRGQEAAVPASVAIPTPATSPEFPKALGVQVSMLARDGVQQAEIHLHPADMGPISVQIAVDGTRAHVNFGADLAATRQIIESSLPELATALRDAGLTLSGGSVNQQGSGQHGNGSGASSDGRAGSNAAGLSADAAIDGATQRRSMVRVAAGGVDLYA